MKYVRLLFSQDQGGITCGAIDAPRKSSKAIDERVIINFCNKNVVIARFRDKNEVFVLFIIYIYIYINKYSIYLYIHIHFYIDNSFQFITLFALLSVSYGRDHNQQEHKSV